MSPPRYSLNPPSQDNDIRLFMTGEAFKKLRASKGWEAGVDGNVALITVGAGERADTATLKDPVVELVFEPKVLLLTFP